MLNEKTKALLKNFDLNAKQEDPSILAGANKEHGFFIAHVVDKKSGEEFYLECCLMLREDVNGYKLAIKAKDCGYNEGNCGVANDHFISTYNDEENEIYGEELCLALILKSARKEGVRVV